MFNRKISLILCVLAFFIIEGSNHFGGIENVCVRVWRRSKILREPLQRWLHVTERASVLLFFPIILNFSVFAPFGNIFVWKKKKKRKEKVLM